MKKYLYLITPLLILLSISCQAPSVKISADFDKGSIGNFTEAVPNHLTGTTKHWLKRDSIGDQYYWFYFKAEQVKNKRVTFELKDLIGLNRKKYRQAILNLYLSIHNFVKIVCVSLLFEIKKISSFN